MQNSIRRKLIEVALPLEAINAASAREKSIRHGHPSTLHLWWARRPLAACRAVLFAQLVDDPSAWPERFPTEDQQKAERARLHELIERLVPWEASTDEAVLNEARYEIARSLAWGRGEEPPPASQPEAVRQYLLDHAPPIYDPFCGGGSIPLEAQRLGLRAIASDLNPVAVMITKALIEFPSKFAGLPPVNPEAQAKLTAGGAWNAKGAQGLAEDVRWYGKWMRDEAEKRIGHLYPKATLPDGTEATVIAWLWARTVRSPNPAARGAMVPLVSSFLLSTRPGKKAWVEIVPDASARDGWRFAVRTAKEHGTPPQNASDGTIDRKGGRCALTGVAIPFKHIRAEGKAGRMGARLMAIVAEGRRGRIYLPPDDEHVRISETAKPTWAPASELPRKALGFRVQEYGMTRHCDLFKPRQLIALTTFSDLVLEARAKALEDARAARLSADPISLSDGGPGAQAYADALAAYLALATDRLADRLSSLCGWDSGYVKIRNTFGRQALPMVWDFAEGNPFSNSSGNFGAATGWIAKVIEVVPTGRPGSVSILDAANGMRLVPSSTITDPPYYDNIGYADLSDFFYVWLRRTLKDVFPQEFATVLVPKERELVATPYRFAGRQQEAEQFFLNGMRRAISNVHRASVDGLPTTIYYAFKQAEIDTEDIVSTGWATFLDAVIDAGFEVDGTWPVRTELSNRMVGRGANALASSIVLVCRKRPQDAPSVGRAEFLRALRQELPAALKTLQTSTIAPVDMAQASIGPGMAVFSRYSEVLETDDTPMSIRTALMLINHELDAFLAEQEGEFDSYSRFAVGWFEQFGWSAGKYGQAEVMATGRGTAVQAIVEAGILRARAGEARLLKRDELDPAWDIRTDTKITVWECCQHLIRRLEGEGEESAARLLKTLRHYGDLARDLAYRLYAVCERKRWAEEARAYNGLIVAWPQIARLAEQLDADPVPSREQRQPELAI